MKKIIYLFITPLLCIGQFYNGPESIEYNSVDNSYFISNSGNGQILKLNADESLSVFVNNVGNGPHGLEIVEDVLYACSGGRIKGYDLSSGEQVLNYNVGGAFLNGITHFIDGGGSWLFITDFSAKKLYRYHIDTQEHLEIMSFTKNPNGIYHDFYDDRLIIVFWGNNAGVYEIDVTDETSTVLIENTQLNNLDGITMDECGNFLISAWSTNSIHRFSNDFSESEVIVNGLNNPADIHYNWINNTLAIPNSGSNSVSFIDYDAGPPTGWGNCNNSSITPIIKHKNLINRVDIFGRSTKKKSLHIEIYDDGSVIKKYFLK